MLFPLRRFPLPLSLVAALSLGPCAALAAPVPLARLTPVDVPGTAPMSAAAVDLATLGYTEQEFFTEGTAQRYRGATLGQQDTAEIIDGGFPYRSRVLLRRPAPAVFNGTLVVEWTNVTAGQDIDFAFAEMHDFLLSQGYAVAVVSVQKNGVDRLKRWNPARYGSLSVDADNTDPKGGPVDACVAGPDCPVDPLAWDIFSQTVAALKDTGDAAPLAGYDVERVIALGQSQSAFRLAGYYNAIQPLTHLFDGFLFDDLAPQLRADQPVPAISVNSEVTADLFPPARPGDFVRIWDLAGAAHSSVYGADYVDRMVLRDAGYPGKAGPLSFTDMLKGQHCALPPSYSPVDTGAALSAALVALEAWAEHGTPAPASQVFARDAAGKVRRDAEGRPIGGLQLPEFAVPATRSEINGPSVFCTLSGFSQALEPAELTARYGTKDAFVAAVGAAGKALVHAGYLLPADAKASVDRAEAVDFTQ